jgi:hypothetical protein
MMNIKKLYKKMGFNTCESNDDYYYLKINYDTPIVTLKKITNTCKNIISESSYFSIDMKNIDIFFI